MLSKVGGRSPFGAVLLQMEQKKFQFEYFDVWQKCCPNAMSVIFFSLFNNNSSFVRTFFFKTKKKLLKGVLQKTFWEPLEYKFSL